MGPVEQAIRTTFRTVPITLYTIGQHRAFVFSQMKPHEIVLLLGQDRNYTPLKWDCLESVVPFLQSRPGCVRAGGQRSVDGEPGTLDEHLKKRFIKRDVARWLVVVLVEAGVAEICEAERALSIRLTQRFR